MNVRMNDSHHEVRAILVSDGTFLKESIPLPLPPSEPDSKEAKIYAIFNSVWDATPTVMEFNPMWANGTGYFDHIKKDEKIQQVLKIGEKAKFTNPGGRRGIIIRTRFGNIAVFERYKGENLITANLPREVDNTRKAMDVRHPPYWTVEFFDLMMNHTLDFLAKVDTLKAWSEIEA